MKVLLISILLLMFADAFAQHEIDSLWQVNGTKLFVSIRGKGEPIIAIHGGPGLNHSYFKPHLGELEKKFKVIYYDQRASGKSAIPPPDSISRKFLIEDLEALRKLLKLNKINLLAHSWGAMLAIHYALDYPAQLNKIILSNPGMLSREFDQEVTKLVKARTTPDDSIARAKLMTGKLDAKKYEGFFLLSFKTSAYDPMNLTKLNLDIPSTFSEANKALFGGLMNDPAKDTNLYSLLKKINVPVLVIQGKADIVPPASIALLKKNLREVQIVVFEKSGHFPFVEEPEEYVRAIETFLHPR